MTNIAISSPLANGAAQFFPAAPRFARRQPLASGRPIAFYRAYAKLTGSVAAGLFLSQLSYWTGTMHAKHGASFDGWIYKTAAEWEAETGLSVRELATARRKCRELGLISDPRAGVCGTVHYFLHFDVLQRLLQNSGYAVNSNAPRCSTETPEAPFRFSENAKPYKDTESKEKNREKEQTAAAPIVADSKESVSAPLTPAEAALIEIGVSIATAADLADRFAEPEIFQQIEWLDARKPDANRAGLLIKAILGRWPAPATAKTKYAPPATMGAAYSDHRVTDTHTAPSDDDEMNAAFEALPEAERAAIDAALIPSLGFLAVIGKAGVALAPLRREEMRKRRRRAAENRAH